MSAFETRRDKLRRLIRKQGLDALLVTNCANVTYLTGFTGDSSYLLVAKDLELLITDFRYTTQLAEECPGLPLQVRPASETIVQGAASVLKSTGLSKVGVETNSMTVATHSQLGDSLPEVSLVPTPPLVEQLRMIKDKDELAAIQRAIRQAERAFGVLKATLRPDQTEKSVADDLEHQIRLQGGKCTSFPPIVAVGPRAALPHAHPTGAEIGSAGLVLVDWGADEGLYKSDLTRVLVTGKISPKVESVYGVVLNAQRRAIEAIRPGATCGEVDAVARGVIADAGFNKYFGHGLGHGVGLDIHEALGWARGKASRCRPAW